MPPARVLRCHRCVNKYHVRPLLLLLVTVVYVGMGGAGFLFFEQSHHMRVADGWHQQMREERREFVRYIARRIFNDTTTLLIVIDQDQTAKVHERLYDSLKRYERKKLKLVSPYTHDWSLPNSVAYSLGLLTTVGQAGRTPATLGGQVFALCYALLGIPFFLGTITSIAFVVILPLFANAAPVLASRSALHKFLKVVLVTAVFFSWFFVISAVLYFFSAAFNGRAWHAAFTVGMSLLTVQISDWQLLEPWALSMIHMSVAFSLLLFTLIVLLLARWGRPATPTACRPDTVHDACTSSQDPKKFNVTVEKNSSQDPKKFSVTVDKNGSSKLLASPEVIRPSP